MLIDGRTLTQDEDRHIELIVTELLKVVRLNRCNLSSSHLAEILVRALGSQLVEAKLSVEDVLPALRERVKIAKRPIRKFTVIETSTE